MEETRPRYPLTQSQLSLWTGQRMHPGSPLHNLVYTFEITGEIDTAVFKEAFQHVVDHVDMLRTVFEEKNGEVFQYIRDPFLFELETIDLTSAKASDTRDVTPEDAAKDWISRRGPDRLWSFPGGFSIPFC